MPSSHSPAPSAVLRHVGRERSPVLVIDQATGDPGAVVEIAAALAPFAPAAAVAYPGVRRVIGPGDAAAARYSHALLGKVAGIVNRAFAIDGFDLLEASFSIVTADPASLSPQQRIPHFDAPDPMHLALLHYLGDAPGSGTAFFRQRATGIERVRHADLARFVVAAQTEGDRAIGYCQGSTEGFEQIGIVEAIPDRLVIYQGSLLHTGIIPTDLSLSADPQVGRLTANFFVRGRPGKNRV